jgi:hypothetical protein
MNWDMFALLCPRAAQEYLVELCMPGLPIDEFIGPKNTDVFWVWEGEVGARFADAFHAMEFTWDGEKWEEKA